MNRIYLGKERVQTEDGITTIKFELLPRKYSVCYIEEDNLFYYGIDNCLLGGYKSIKEAKCGLINFLKKYHSEHLAKINERYIA
ncbi:MAG: hypothetical protein ACI31M_00940 [Bacilli bacterium]